MVSDFATTHTFSNRQEVLSFFQNSNSGFEQPRYPGLSASGGSRAAGGFGAAFYQIVPTLFHSFTGELIAVLQRGQFEHLVLTEEGF